MRRLWYSETPLNSEIVHACMRACVHACMRRPGFNLNHKLLSTPGRIRTWESFNLKQKGFNLDLKRLESKPSTCLDKSGWFRLKPGRPCTWVKISQLWDLHLATTNGFKHRQLAFVQCYNIYHALDICDAHVGCHESETIRLDTPSVSRKNLINIWY